MAETVTDINADEIALWNGKAGEKWTVNQQSQDQLVAVFGQKALDAAAPRAGERVIDVGCGCGTSTFQIARAVSPGGHVTGVDVSRMMLDLARDRAAAEPGPPVTFVDADASTHPLPEGEADLVFSRFGVMFFANTETAFANFHRALRPGGRIAFVCWRSFEDNEWVFAPRRAAAGLAELPAPPGTRPPSPFGFGEKDYVRGLLAGAGFAEIAIEPFDAPVFLGETLDDAVVKIAVNSPLAAALAALDRDRRAAARDAVRRLLEPRAAPEGVTLGGAVWIVTARR